MSASLDVSPFVHATPFYSQTQRFDPLHLTIAIAEQTPERLASHAELKKGSPDILVPFAGKFMEDKRQLSLK